MKIVTDSNQIDKKKWSDFVKNHPNGSVFQTPEIFEVYKNTNLYEPVFVAVISNDEVIEGILIAVIQKENSGIIGMMSSRSIVFGGPLWISDKDDILDVLLKEYNKHYSKKAIYTQFRNFSLQSNIVKERYKKNGFEFNDHLNILVDLSIGVDNLWKGTKRSRKDGINKAKKQGFVFEVKESFESIDNFYSLFEELYKKVKLPYPDKSFFKYLNSDATNDVKWFVLKYQDKPCIILCSFVYNTTIYAFSIGISQDSKLQKLRPVDLFYWEVIKWGAENGYNIFDWMGAGKPDEEYGVRKFKLQYGGDVFNFGRYEIIHKPMLMKTALFGLKVWQKLKN